MDLTIYTLSFYCIAVADRKKKEKKTRLGQENSRYIAINQD